MCRRLARGCGGYYETVNALQALCRITQSSGDGRYNAVGLTCLSDQKFYGWWDILLGQRRAARMYRDLSYADDDVDPSPWSFPSLPNFPHYPLPTTVCTSCIEGMTLRKVDELEYLA